MADKAVLIGINDYESISPLRGCVNDTGLMQLLLEEDYGFQHSNIEVLTDEEAIRRNIEAAMEWLYRDVGENDRLLFHFSGHGSYTEDEDGDEPMDELLCLQDMDWYDRSTYLLDDDLRKWTAQLPVGAKLTVVLDCCHSGTGTRMLVSPAAGGLERVDTAATVARAFTKSRARSKDPARVARMSERELTTALLDEIGERTTEADARKLVLARFAEPPPEIRARVRRVLGVHPVAASPDAAMNHVLLAGSRDDQTSADAYLGNNYYGAFTYTLVEALRAQPQQSLRDLIRQVRRSLQEQFFSQIPQLEPAKVEGTFLDATPGGLSRPEQKLDWQSGGELVAAIRELATAVRGTRPSDRPTSAGLQSGVSRQGERAVVYVHGIGRHDPDYSRSWWEAVLHYEPSFRRRHRAEVLWSDLVNRAAALSRSDQREREELIQRIRSNLQGRHEEKLNEASRGHRASTRSAEAQMRDVRGSSIFEGVDDFASYMTSETVRNNILTRFADEVQPLLADGLTLDVIGHSWGTVVAYEGLRELSETGGFSGRVANLFTVGSALSIFAVRENLFSRTGDGRLPSLVEQWYNLDADWDLVGGRLDRSFQVSDEFLGLSPTGCDSFWGVTDPVCAHSSYFRLENRRVNAEIFGRLMRH